jgi:hypothetical protein
VAAGHPEEHWRVAAGHLPHEQQLLPPQLLLSLPLQMLPLSLQMLPLQMPLLSLPLLQQLRRRWWQPRDPHGQLQQQPHGQHPPREPRWASGPSALFPKHRAHPGWRTVAMCRD